MDYIRTCLFEEFFQIAKVLFNAESLEQLLSHEFLAVAYGGDLATFYPLDLRCM